MLSWIDLGCDRRYQIWTRHYSRSGYSGCVGLRLIRKSMQRLLAVAENSDWTLDTDMRFKHIESVSSILALAIIIINIVNFNSRIKSLCRSTYRYCPTLSRIQAAETSLGDEWNATISYCTNCSVAATSQDRLTVGLKILICLFPLQVRLVAPGPANS